MEQTLQYLQQNWLEIFSLVTGLIFLILAAVLIIFNVCNCLPE